MKSRNILGFYAGVFLLCTLKIHGTPVRNLQSNEQAKKSEHLLQIRSAIPQDESFVKNQRLSELVDSDLLSYIDGSKQKFDLEESGTKEVRANKPKKAKCKGQKPPEPVIPHKWPLFQGFNPHSGLNKDCIIGDLMLTPEECLVLTRKKLHY